MERTPEIKSVLDKVTTQAFGRTVDDSIEKRICTFCGGTADTFRDYLSEKEYSISGMCQTCQDEMFDEDEE